MLKCFMFFYLQPIDNLLIRFCKNFSIYFRFKIISKASLINSLSSRVGDQLKPFSSLMKLGALESNRVIRFNSPVIGSLFISSLICIFSSLFMISSSANVNNINQLIGLIVFFFISRGAS